LNDEPKRLIAHLGTMINQLAPNFIWSSLLIFPFSLYKKLALMPRKYYYFPGSMYKTYYNCVCFLAIVINIK